MVTTYRPISHADVIVGKILEGYRHDGGAGPDLQLASLYVDRMNERDMSRPSDLAPRYGFTLYDSIEGALTLGGPDLAVDGVLCIAEHGPYPIDANGQVLHPKRPFFEAIFGVFQRSGRSVPVFTSKHLGNSWEDAKWVYDRAKALGAPLLAGSVLPVTWRRPELSLPLGSPLVEAAQIGCGAPGAWAFHALEALQCMAERRQGGETGVASVQCLEGADMWEAVDTAAWPVAHLEAALSRVQYHHLDDVRTLTSDPKSGACLAFIHYRDGFKAVAALLNGWVFEGDGESFVFAGRIQGQPLLAITRFVLQRRMPHGEFAALVRAIDATMQSGSAAYPVERTLLTSGMLDAFLTSKAEGGRVVDTPHLAISYQPADWPYATDPIPPTV